MWRGLSLLLYTDSVCSNRRTELIRDLLGERMYAMSERRNAAYPRVKPALTGLYKDSKDRTRHVENMRRVALEVNCTVQMISPIYERTLARLKQGATVQDFLPILVAKGVKRALKDVEQPH